MQKDRKTETKITVDNLKNKGTIQLLVEKDGKAVIEFIPNTGIDMEKYKNALPVPKENND